MYQTTIEVHSRTSNKETQKLLIPVFIWALIAFVCLGMVSARLSRTVNVIGVIGLLLCAVGLIPMCIFSVKKAMKVRAKHQKKQAVMISVFEKALYIENMKLIATYYPDIKEVSLREAGIPEGEGFCASINVKETSEFIRFCEESEVEYEVFDEI